MANDIILSKRDAQIIRNFLTNLRRGKYDPKPLPKRRGNIGIGNINIKWAILQEALQSDGLLSVKLLDSEGAATGDAFDVWAFPSHTTSITVADWMWSTFTTPAANDKVMIALDQYGEWCVIAPMLIKKDSC